MSALLKTNIEAEHIPLDEEIHLQTSINYHWLVTEFLSKSMYLIWGIHIIYIYISLSQWKLKKKFERLIFPTKDVIPESLKFSNWLSQI